MMDWLPQPLDFAGAIRELRGIDDPKYKLDRLISVANCRLTYLETIQLNSELEKLAEEDCGAGQLPSVNVAIVGSSTFEHLLPAMRIAGLRLRLWLRPFTGLYGQYRQELLQPEGLLTRCQPDFIIVSTASTEVLGEVRINSSNLEVDQLVGQFVQEMRVLWQSAQENFGCQIIQQSILDVSSPMLGSYDRYVPGIPSAVIRQCNDLMAIAAAEEKVLWLGVATHAARDGIAYWFDLARWYQGKMEIAPNAAIDYGELVVRLIGAQMGRSRKCLVFDLDNTLWGGVIGDDGLEGIVLGEGSALGEAFLAIQKYAISLKEAGVILAVCSKNDASIARHAFENHPEMLLSLDDIALFVANWDDKAKNLVTIASELNIGLDALVFVDDNAVERSRIRESLPDVAVPELPADPAFYVPTIASAGYFEAVAFTTDDSKRAQQYKENADRKRLQDRLTSMSDFLRGLNMETDYGQVDSISLVRATQLINKTNQFNATTERLTEGDIQEFASESKNAVYQFRLRDRFGDNGLVSVILLGQAEGNTAALEIVNWVMSCRVFGRQFEDEIMNIIIDIARNREASTLRATYVPNDRNKVICELFPRLGFTKHSVERDGSINWELQVPEYKLRKTFIRRALP